MKSRLFLVLLFSLAFFGAVSALQIGGQSQFITGSMVPIYETDPLYSAAQGLLARTGSCTGNNAVQTTTTSGVTCIAIPTVPTNVSAFANDVPYAKTGSCSASNAVQTTTTGGVTCISLPTDTNCAATGSCPHVVYDNNLAGYYLQSDANSVFVKKADGNMLYALKTDVNSWGDARYYPLNSNPAGYLTTAQNIFDQNLNTTNDVNFSSASVSKALIGSSSSLSATKFAYGGVAVMHSNCTETDYAATTDTNLARGTALMSAVNADVNGDVLYLSAGAFDINNSNIDLSIGGTGSVSIHGAGKNLTTIKKTFVSGSNPFLIMPGNNGSQTTDLTLQAYGDNFVFLWGTGSPVAHHAVANAFVNNVNFIGITDGIYTNTSYSISANVIKSSFSSIWDCMRVGSSGTINVYDSTMVSAFDGRVTTYNDGRYAHGLYVIGSSLDNTHVNFYDTNISASGASSQNIGIDLIGSAFGTITDANLYDGSRVSTSGTGASDLTTDTHSSIGVSPSVVYTTHSGTINSIPEVPEVVPPVPAETCTNPFTLADLNIQTNGKINLKSQGIVSDTNIQAPYFLGNGSLLTGISSVDTNWQTGWSTFDTNMKNQYRKYAVDLNTSQNINADGNISAAYFKGNGSLLTGIVSGGADTNEVTAGHIDSAGVRLTDFNFGGKSIFSAGDFNGVDAFLDLNFSLSTPTNITGGFDGACGDGGWLDGYNYSIRVYPYFYKGGVKIFGANYGAYTFTQDDGCGGDGRPIVFGWDTTPNADGYVVTFANDMIPWNYDHYIDTTTNGIYSYDTTEWTAGTPTVTPTSAILNSQYGVNTNGAPFSVYSPELDINAKNVYVSSGGDYKKVSPASGTRGEIQYENNGVLGSDYNFYYTNPSGTGMIYFPNGMSMYNSGGSLSTLNLPNPLTTHISSQIGFTSSFFVPLLKAYATTSGSGTTLINAGDTAMLANTGNSILLTAGGIQERVTSNGVRFPLKDTNFDHNVILTSATSWSGYAVCYLANGALGHCTSAVGSGGTCTCAGN